MKRILAAVAFSFLFSSVSTGADFVGSESCRSCHQEAYEHWRKGPHARAHLSLTPAQARDPKCIQCHAPDTEKGGDPGVSCESCHGAGEYYLADYVMKDAELAAATGLVMPKAADCLLCHDASSPSLEAFNAAHKMKEIDHWTKSREARKAKSKKSAEASGPCELPARRVRAEAALAADPNSFLSRALQSKSPPARESSAEEKASPVSLAQTPQAQ